MAVGLGVSAGALAAAGSFGPPSTSSVPDVPPPVSPDGSDMSQLQQLHATPVTDATVKDPFTGLRAKSMVEAATALGAQHGLRWRTEQINQGLQDIAGRLDRLYDFRSVLLDGGMVVPPVIQEARSTWTGDALAARSAQVEYHIVSPARISPVAPNWRDWLLQAVPDPMQADPGLLPHTDEERKAWAEGVAAGWSAGVAQADAIFEVNINRLTRDLTGMLLFLKLEREHMVSAPMLANGQVGVEVSGQALAIGQRIFRLTMDSSFQPQNRWEPMAAPGPVLPRLAPDVGAGGR